MATQIYRRVRLGHKGLYYCRVLVPVGLSAILNRKAFVRCLHTAEYGAATLKALQWNGQLASLFLHLRRTRPAMKPEHIKALVHEYVTKALQDGEDERHERMLHDDERDSIVQALSDMLEETHETLLHAPRSLKENFKGHTWLLKQVRETADELLSSHRVTLAHDSPEYERLCAELLKAQQIVLKTEMERWEGNYHHQDTAAYSIHSYSSHNGHHAAFALGLSLSEMVQQYFKHHERAWAPRTAAKKRGILDRFLQIVSEGRADVTVQDVKKPECVRYRDVLRKLPNDMATRYHGKSIAEVLTLVSKKKTYTSVSDNTVNQCLEHVGHFFTWLNDEGKHTGGNPASRLQLKGVDEDNRYEPFTDDEIQRLFGSEFVEHLPAHPERYWVTLIGLYSGMRLGEVSQLAVTDVQRENDIWYFDVKPDKEEGKRLKNAASQRRVPVHSHLVELGLLMYLKKLKSTGSAELFPALIQGKDRGRGDAVGKWFGRHRKEVGVGGTKKVFHSFRHTMQTRLRGVVAPDVIKMLVGHKDEGMTDHYTHMSFVQLSMLRDALEKLEFRPLLQGLCED
jgi:integrase